MSQEKSPGCFAFLTVRCSDAVGFFGGLLSINPLGRPVEFHCSLPIKPSRAQLILYGDSLNDFIVGEHIAYAIIGKVRTAPQLILTDLVAALSLRRLNAIPIAYVHPTRGQDSTPSLSTGFVLERPTSQLDQLLTDFELGDSRLSLLSEFANDISGIQKTWQASAPQFNLQEPFDRIVEALREANPTTKAA